MTLDFLPKLWAWLLTRARYGARVVQSACRTLRFAPVSFPLPGRKALSRLKWLKKLSRRYVRPPLPAVIALLPLEEQARQAHQEWVCAQRLFAEVTEPDLVDQAIYLMEAAERRYVYLLRSLKKQREIS